MNWISFENQYTHHSKILSTFEFPWLTERKDLVGGGGIQGQPKKTKNAQPKHIKRENTWESFLYDSMSFMCLNNVLSGRNPPLLSSFVIQGWERAWMDLYLFMYYILRSPSRRLMQLSETKSESCSFRSIVFTSCITYQYQSLALFFALSSFLV